MMIALFALAVAAPPLGADWTIVAETDAGVMAIDPASVEADGDGRSVWTRAAFIDSDGLAATVVALNHVDCARRTSARLRVLSLDEGGTVVEDEDVDTNARPVGAGSVAEAVLEQVCA